MPKFKTGVCISKRTQGTAAVTAAGVSMRLRNALIALVGATLLIAGIACGGSEPDGLTLLSYCREVMAMVAEAEQLGVPERDWYRFIANHTDMSYLEVKNIVEICREALED